jgi:hypothetical protein
MVDVSRLSVGLKKEFVIEGNTKPVTATTTSNIIKSGRDEI